MNKDNNQVLIFDLKTGVAIKKPEKIKMSKATEEVFIRYILELIKKGKE